MEILNVGPLELVVILLLAFIVMGPEGMVNAAGKLGTMIRKFLNSSIWKEITGSYRDLSNFSEEIIRKTGLEESVNEINELNNAAVEFDRLQRSEVQSDTVVERKNQGFSERVSTENGKLSNLESENQIQPPDRES